MGLRDDHSAGPKRQLQNMALVLAVLTVFALVSVVVLQTKLVLYGVIAAWAVLLVYSALLFLVIEPGGEALGGILMPSGKSTPGGKGYSHIEALVARGELVKAAEAYRAEIAADPADLGACERLGLLAMRELKDYELALFAYRQAEQRAVEPNRKLGNGLIVAGLYRDQLKDPAKAVVELRRLIERYPGAPNVAMLRSELERLKESLFAGGAA